MDKLLLTDNSVYAETVTQVQSLATGHQKHANIRYVPSDSYRILTRSLLVMLTVRSRKYNDEHVSHAK